MRHHSVYAHNCHANRLCRHAFNVLLTTDKENVSASYLKNSHVPALCQPPLMNPIPPKHTYAQGCTFAHTPTIFREFFALHVTCVDHTHVKLQTVLAQDKQKGAWLYWSVAVRQLHGPNPPSRCVYSGTDMAKCFMERLLFTATGSLWFPCMLQPQTHSHEWG